MGGPHPRFIGLRFLTAQEFDFHRLRRADELERQRLMIVLRTDLVRLSEAKHWPPPTSPSNSNLISNPNAALKKHKETITQNPKPLRKLDNPAFLLYKPKDKKLVTEEEWSCALCKVRNNSQRSWREHLRGRKHKANEAALIAEIKSNSLPKQENPPSEKQKQSLKFWCEACGVGTHSLDVMSDHKKGKRHIRSVKKEVAVVC